MEVEFYSVKFIFKIGNVSKRSLQDPLNNLNNEAVIVDFQPTCCVTGQPIRILGHTHRLMQVYIHAQRNISCVLLTFTNQECSSIVMHNTGMHTNMYICKHTVRIHSITT